MGYFSIPTFCSYHGQAPIIRTYDAPPYVPDAFKGGIPFIDIANQAVTSGASYDTQVLVDRSWQDITSELSHVDSPVTQGIVGSANYIIASICTLTKEHPAAICHANIIQRLQVEESGMTSASWKTPLPNRW